jgi:hypothetical protein
MIFHLFLCIVGVMEMFWPIINECPCTFQSVSVNEHTLEIKGETFVLYITYRYIISFFKMLIVDRITLLVRPLSK